MELLSNDFLVVQSTRKPLPNLDYPQHTGAFDHGKIRAVAYLLTLFAAALILLGARTAQAQDDSFARQAPPPSSGPVEVGISFHLLDVHAIDDEAETFDFSGILQLNWKNERQSFKPEEVGAQELLFHGDFQFNELSPSWFPQVVMSNAVSRPESSGILLRVEKDGSSTLTQMIHAQARSPLQLRRFPFDTQKLVASFRILGFGEKAAVLKPIGQGLTVDAGGVNIPEWSLKGISSHTELRAGNDPRFNSKSSVFSVALNVERQSFYMLRLVLLPLLLIVALSWSVFWMDCSSVGDRMSVSFVGILTAVAYQSMIADLTPQVAYLTFMNAFVSLSFLLMSATAVINLWVASLDRAGKVEFANHLDRHCRWIFPLASFLLLATSWIVSML